MPKKQPPFFYGYIIVSLSFLVMVLCLGLHNAFGVFLKPLISNLGWTSAATSGAFSISMIFYGLLSFFQGRFADRFGPRVVLSVSGLLIGLGYFLVSLIGEVWQLYALYAVIGISMGGSWVPLLSAVARWFVKRRGLMTGIVVSGVGIGQLITPPIITRLIVAYDWRTAYAIVGATVLVIVFTAAQFMKRDPARIGLLPYGAAEAAATGSEPEAAGGLSLKEALHTPQFWLIFVMFLCIGTSVISVLVHIVAHTGELGITAIHGANILAIMGGMSVAGAYVLGAIGDRNGNKWIFIIAFAIITVSMALLLFCRELWMLYSIAVILGFALGMGVGESPLTAELFGLKAHGSILGLAHLSFTFGGALGPWIAGYIFDVTGAYRGAFILSAALGAASLVLALLLRPIPRKTS